MPNFLEAITPDAMRERLADLCAADSATLVLSYLLGPERLLQWAHSVGVSSHPTLRACASPVPPRELRALGGAPDEPVYLWTGLVDIANFFGIYARLGSPPGGRKPRVLDFGCQSGRLARYLNMHTGIEAFAVDANPLLVEWCQLNLPQVLTLLQAGRQRLPFGDALFDFVYANTLFTGAAQSRLQHSLGELTRVMAPGSVLLAITFGPTALATIRGSATHQAALKLDAVQAAEFAETLPQRGRIHLPFADEASLGKPAEERDGRTFLHPDYLAAHWNTDAFEVLEHIPGGVRNWHDIVVLRRK